jgi:hypothetical protein
MNLDLVFYEYLEAFKKMVTIYQDGLKPEEFFAKLRDDADFFYKFDQALEELMKNFEAKYDIDIVHTFDKIVLQAKVKGESDEDLKTIFKDHIISLKRFGSIINERVREDDDLVICLDGRTGSSKSTLSYWLGKVSDKHFKVDVNMLCKPDKDEILNFFKTFPKYSVIVLDEAITALYKMFWNSDKQKFLNTLFNIIRADNMITILNIPRLKDLNEYFRNERVYCRINCIKRGIGAVFFYDTTIDADDPFMINENVKRVKAALGGKIPAFVGMVDYMRALMDCPNFGGFVFFDKMPEEDDVIYRKIKKEARDALVEEENKADKDKPAKKYQILLCKALWYIKTQNNLKLNQMITEFDVDESVLKWGMYTYRDIPEIKEYVDALTE